MSNTSGFFSGDAFEARATTLDGEFAAASLLDKNTLTTAGVLVGAGTGVAGVALVATALPAQLALATGVSAALIYAGDRQDKGLPLNPWASKDETKTAEAPAAA